MIMRGARGALRETNEPAHGDPIGIVIADGGMAPQPTRLLAYVWGPPDPEPEPVAPPAALVQATAR
jgi:hypothetical protein